MELKSKKIAILLENMYQELEVWYPYYRLIEAGGQVVFVAPEGKKEYKGKYGYPAVSHISIDEAKSDEFDAVVIPGGFAPDYMRREARMAQFIHEMHESEKLVAAICHGPWMLASADILKDKKATCYYAIADDIKNAGAQYLDQEVVIDHNLITARKPDDLPAFCKAIMNALTK